MEKNEKDAITSLLTYLCENTTSVDHLTNLAIAASLMTVSEKEEILSARTSLSRNERFFVHMMKKPESMEHLLRFLRHIKNDGVAQRLQEQLNMEKISTLFQNSTKLVSSSSSGRTEVQYIEGNVNIVAHRDINLYIGKQIKTDPKPAAQLTLRNHFNLYFPSRYFTGRKRHLLTLDETIETLLKETNPRNKIAVISGLGGVGKTEFVREYAATTKRVNYIVVINAASYTTAQKDFEDLAAKVFESSDQRISKDQKMYYVYRYFSERRDGKTLFIFENAGHWARSNSHLFLPNESVGPGNNQLPTVLIISRLNDWEWLSLRIDGWDREEAVEYLTNRILKNQEAQLTEAVKTWLPKLGSSLHYYPLGLSIAISKILEDQNPIADNINNYLRTKQNHHDTWRVQEISNLAPTDYKLTMDTVLNEDIQNIYSIQDYGLRAVQLLRMVSNPSLEFPGRNPRLNSWKMHELFLQHGLDTEVHEALKILHKYSIFVRRKNEDGELLCSQIHNIIQLCEGKWIESYLRKFYHRIETSV